MTSEKKEEIKKSSTMVSENLISNMDNQEDIVRQFKDYGSFISTIDTEYFFTHFFQDFVDENGNLKYKDRIVQLTDINPIFDIEANDLLQYNKYLYEYFINEPEVCYRHIREALFDYTQQLHLPIEKEALDIRIRTSEIRSISELRSKDINKYTHITGEVMGITQIFSKYTTITWHCPVCQTEMEIDQDIYSKNITQPYKCANPSCNNKKAFIMIFGYCKRINIQYGFLRESQDKDLKNNNVMRFIVYEKDCGLKAGSIIDLYGIYIEELLESRNGIKNQATYLMDSRVIDVKGEVPFQETLNTDYSRIYLNEKGIFLDIVSEDQAKTECLFKWDKFEIYNRFKVKEGTSFVPKYNGAITIKSLTGDNVFDFTNATIDDIKNVLLKNCSVSTKNMNLITLPIQKYLASFKDESDKLTKVIGFTEKGWRLPFNSIYLIEDNMGEEIYNNLKKIFDKTYDFNELKTKFIELYNLTGIKYKENLFQWVMASPFSSVFRTYAGIMPALALHGIGEVGKTQFFEMAFCRLFGHLDNIISANTLKSDSRLEGILASSTFPVCLDEVTNAHKSIIDELKTHLTMDAKFIRKGAGQSKQFNSIEKVKCTPFSITCNDPPEWFDDPYFLQRTIVFMIDTLTKNAGWNEAKNNCIRGLLTILIYEYTKNWTYKELRDYVKSIPVPANLEKKKDSRPKSIYQFFGLGKKLLKDIFDIETDLKDIENIIDSTRNISFDTFSALIEYQIDKGRIKLTSEGYKVQTDNWVKTPVYEGTFIDEFGNKTDCWGFTINNIRELQEKLEGNTTHKWNLNTFANKIISVYQSIQYGRYCLSKINESDITSLVTKQERCILIPKSNFDNELQTIKKIDMNKPNGETKTDKLFIDAEQMITTMVQKNCQKEDIIESVLFQCKIERRKIVELVDRIVKEIRKND